MDAGRSGPVREEDLPFELVGGGDCTKHFHSVDRAPTHDTLGRLQDLNTQTAVTGNYSARYSDDILLVSTGSTVTLPLARRGKEFEVVMTGTAIVTVAFSGADTLYGAASVLLTAQGMALRFKAVTGGWVLI